MLKRGGTSDAGHEVGTPRACGLCGKTNNLVRTECCKHWVCDDEKEYVPFSYAQNSCSRNHRRYTLCGYHCAEEHPGTWKECSKCKESFETEIYVWYGTNEHNFERLENPPRFNPTFCAGCHRRIRLGTDGYLLASGKYWCEQCGARVARTRGKRRKRDA